MSQQSLRDDIKRMTLKINFKKIPALYWDNQRAGGVPWAIRALTQMLGKTETAAWRKKFKKIGAQLAASS